MNKPAHKRFSSSVAVTFVARLVMAANSVVAGVLVARLLGAESLGAYLVLTVAVQSLIHVSGFSLHIANTYFTARDVNKLPVAGVNSVLFGIISGGVCTAIFLLFSRSALPGVPFELAVVGLAAVPFQIVTIYFLNLFLAHREIGRFNFIDLANQSFVLLNAVVALVLIGGGLSLLVSLNTLAAIAMALISGAMLYRFASVKVAGASWKPDLSLLREMLAYSAKGYLLWMSMLLLYRVDLLVVNYFKGAAEAAVYAVATQCTLFLLLLPQAISQLLQAKVAADRDEGGEFTCRVSRVTTVLMFAACIASIPGAYLVAFIYGPGFERLPHLLWLLLPGVLFVGVQQVVAQYFLGTGLPLKAALTWLAALLTNILANILVVPTHGATGAAVVSTLCYIAVSIVMFAFFTKTTGRRITELIIPDPSDLRKLWLTIRKNR